MKTHLSLIFIFVFLLGSGQTLETTYEKQQERYHKKYLTLMDESKTIDLKKLGKIVLKTIDESKLKKDNLVFVLKDLDVKIFYFEIDAYEYVPSTVINPYFNQAIFWTENNAKYLVKKFKKNLISSKSDYNVFIDYNRLKNLDNKIFAKELSNQKLGKYKKEEGGKISEKEFLYFPYKKKENLKLESIEKENINFDIINIEFQNFEGKIVSFRIIYNSDKENSVTKTYQYQNKKWLEIPTVEEYKF